MKLIYDGKCSFCRGLAYRIALHSGGKVETLALGDPEAVKILERFYPDGAEHDFYVVDGDRCRRGALVLPGLLRSIGIRETAGLLGEYAGFRRASRECGAAHAHEEDEATGTSRRSVLKFAAAAPFLAAAAKLPTSAFTFGGFESLQIRVVAVVPDRSGRLRAYVRSVAPLPAPRQPKQRTESTTTTTLLEDRMVRDEALPGLASTTGDAYLRVRRVASETTRVADGTARTDRFAMRSALVDHARYDVGLNLGTSRMPTNKGDLVVSTLAAQISYDIARPYVDVVCYRHRNGDDIARHVEAYRLGIRELARTHRSEGNAALAEMYGHVDAGLAAAGEALAREADPDVPLVKNMLVLTSLTEGLALVPEGVLEAFWDALVELAPDFEITGLDEVDTGELDLIMIQAEGGGACGCGCACCRTCYGCGCSYRCGSRRCGCWRCSNTCSCGCGCCSGC